MKKLFITDMKFLKISSIFFLISILIFSCTKNQDNYNLPNEIAFETEKIFILDSVSTSELVQHQMIKTDSMSYLATMDIVMNHINLFDWESGKIVEKIKFNKDDGPDQLFTPINFYIHNLDSIFVQDLGFGVKLINLDGKVLQNFKIGEVKSENQLYNGIPAYFSSASARPIFFLENKVFYPTTHIDIKEPVLGVFDISNNELEEIIFFPTDGFENGNYIFENIYRTVYWDWDKNKESLYISFPIRNEIYHYDLKDKVLTEISLSPEFQVDFSGHSNVLFSDLRQFGTSEEEKKEAIRRVEIFEKNKSFSSILTCDDIIYRILIHEKKESNVNSFNIDFRDFEVYAYNYKGQLLAKKLFKNPQDDGSVFLVNRMDNFIIKNENSLYVSALNKDQSEEELIYKKLKLK
ncbi:DUF4221 domain-containing protein [Belliella sp. R4-6]|uniref:DUF4221 domain-containing protein n=1 Tax=Belliella alkalica TaxID=1730871 RepID=A0ABS9VDQ6_9BACT|nr:DUF4221 domain-containing protein [Belliella alkalica]MCH7414023.1 DUF4221 domain-containing protein [Belliella alkalica]